MMQSVRVTVDGKERICESGELLSRIIKGEMPCGGHGKCGKCKVIAAGALSPMSESERLALSEEEIRNGVRLACMARAVGDCSVSTSLEQGRGDRKIVTEGDLPAISLQPGFAAYGVAVDIGTTTLAARLYNAAGELLATAARLNSQAPWGADVISRIEADLKGEGRALAKAIRNDLNELVMELAAQGSISTNEIDGMVITGNTVMLHLLTETTTEPLSHAPFRAERLYGETVTAEVLELSALCAETEIYLPSCISAFVGADITCAILSTELTKQEKPSLLADIGTNGELALWANGRLTVCSTAAGPAFEGVGISMGMNAREGAIDRVALDGEALCAHVIGEGTPCGICGSGLIDGVACLLENEILDPSGYLEEDPIVIAEPVTLSQKDIRMVQLAKSAVCAGMTTLIRCEGLFEEDVFTLFVAGGFGKYLNMKNAGRIGLLPSALVNQTRSVGNAALSGAVMLLLDARLREFSREIASKGATVDLSVNPIFMDAYTMGMIFDDEI